MKANKSETIVVDLDLDDIRTALRQYAVSAGHFDIDKHTTPEVTFQLGNDDAFDSELRGATLEAITNPVDLPRMVNDDVEDDDDDDELDDDPFDTEGARKRTEAMDARTDPRMRSGTMYVALGADKTDWEVDPFFIHYDGRWRRYIGSRRKWIRFDGVPKWVRAIMPRDTNDEDYEPAFYKARDADMLEDTGPILNPPRDPVDTSNRLRGDATTRRVPPSRIGSECLSNVAEAGVMYLGDDTKAAKRLYAKSISTGCWCIYATSRNRWVGIPSMPVKTLMKADPTAYTRAHNAAIRQKIVPDPKATITETAAIISASAADREVPYRAAGRGRAVPSYYVKSGLGNWWLFKPNALKWSRVAVPNDFKIKRVSWSVLPVKAKQAIADVSDQTR